ncbi:MAG: peptide deformylase, partial [Candidatus Gastranaerophilales bacterium]|nr:peptide deformylase [Candidatus Gastranaerophilales bacterium]
MAIKEVVIYGDKRLRQPSKEIHKISSKIQKLVDDMYDTMY